MDRGARWASVHGESQTGLSDVARQTSGTSKHWLFPLCTPTWSNVNAVVYTWPFVSCVDKPVLQCRVTVS